MTVAAVTNAAYPDFAEVEAGSAARRWESVVHLERESWLRDHAVFGWPLLPGTGYLDAPLTAARALVDGGAVLTDVRLDKVLFLGEREPTRLAVTLVEAPRGGWHFELEAFGADGWETHATGQLARNADGRPAPRDHSPEGWGAELSGAQHYNGTLAQGALYGETFRGVHRLWRRDGEALAEVVLHDDLRPGAARFAFHPAYLDACLQATVMCHDDEATEGRMFVPVGLDAFRLFASPPRTVWCLAQRRDDAQDGELGADAVLVAEGGAVVAALEGVRGRGTSRRRRRART